MLRWTGTETVTIAPFDGLFPPYDSSMSGGTGRLAIVDCETLGLEPDAPVIETAIPTFAYDKNNGDIRGAIDEYSALHDPGVPIPPEITALTGITTDDVRGQAINPSRVRALLGSVQVIIAHNAAFDRPRVDALIAAGPPIIQPVSVPWACTSTQIDWQALGLPAKSLGALCLAHGFYNTGHRAGSDVAALARLLDTRNVETGRTYLDMLLAEARLPAVIVRAWNSPFATKDTLRGRGYHWDAARKVWWREVREAEAEAERSWLDGNIYGGQSRSMAEVVRIKPAERFARAA